MAEKLIADSVSAKDTEGALINLEYSAKEAAAAVAAVGDGVAKIPPLPPTVPGSSAAV